MWYEGEHEAQHASEIKNGQIGFTCSPRATHVTRCVSVCRQSDAKLSGHTAFMYMYNVTAQHGVALNAHDAKRKHYAVVVNNRTHNKTRTADDDAVHDEAHFSFGVPQTTSGCAVVL